MNDKYGFSAGQPLKGAKKDPLDERMFRIGFQTAKLEADRAQFESEKAQAQTELQAALQQLMSMQVQSAAAQGAMQGAMTMQPAPATMGMSAPPADPMAGAMAGGAPAPAGGPMDLSQFM